ncbi:MAG: hypothetical protein A3J83_01520 [Elusimicrobia bacterium RIFOXYA2_FULL_40_6]|nr:MAG: hypothetical protein A3J83_01520 [Elusimicrobia bacterium RIFOXYA2_FULL_40_6]
MKDIAKFAKEVLQIESEAVKEQIKHIDKDFTDSVNLINEVVENSGRIIIIGMGKSGLIGRKISSTFASIGIPSNSIHPAEIVHGDLGMITGADILIALSYSGESDEFKKILPIIKSLGIKIISITGRANSYIAKFADHVLVTSVKKEACPYNLVPTASTTAMLAMGDALALSVSKLRGFKREDYAKFHPGGILGSKVTLKVEKVMRTGKENPVINQDSSVEEGLVIMTETKLGAISIVDGKNKLTGYFTDGDLRRILQKDKNVLSRKLKDVMTKNPKCIAPDKLALEAAEMMSRYNCDNLPVIDDKGQPLGIIDERDLIIAGIK